MRSRPMGRDMSDHVIHQSCRGAVCEGYGKPAPARPTSNIQKIPTEKGKRVKEIREIKARPGDAEAEDGGAVARVAAAIGGTDEPGVKEPRPATKDP